MGKRIVIALGGNALGNNLPEQMVAVKHTAKAIVDLIQEGHQVVVAHGNGPQVGIINNAMLALMHEDATQDSTPLSVCGAMSQAYIGYDLQNALREEMLNRGMDKPVVTMVTQVEVDPKDPAFNDPSKPIGKFLSEEEAKVMAAKTGFLFKEDAGRGWRRYVASPKPQQIVELGAIRKMVQSGLLVDLTDAVEKGQNYEKDANWGETINPTLLSNCKATLKAIGSDYADKLYGVPFTMTTVAVIYDKNVYKELGLNVPSTWEEFEKNCEAIKAAGKIPVSMQQQNMDWWPRIFWDQYCREELDANPNAFEDGSMTFSSESVKKGLEKFKYMWDQGWFPESGLTGNRETMQQLFVQKELVQVMLQPNYLSYLTENVPEGVELASYALPGVEGKPARCLGGSSSIWAVTNSSKHQEEAIEFVKFMTSKTAFSEDYAKFINPGLTNFELTSDNEAMQGYIDAGKNGFIPDIYVPVNITTEIQNTFLTDLEPNYLLGTYDIDYVTDQLNQLYEETYLSNLN